MTDVSLQIGDIVELTRMQREATIVELLPKQRIKVQLGTLSMIVRSDEVRRLDPQPQKNRVKDAVTIKAAGPSGKESEELDLHGYTVQEALNALENKLNRAIMSNIKRIKVVHGFGSGKVMTAVHEYLKSSTLVSNFMVDNHNPGQTWVWL